MIRPADPSDAAAIAAIWNTVIRDTAITFTSIEKSVDDIERIIAAQPVFVADEGGQAQGFATYFQFRGGIGYRHTVEHTVLLDPEARGAGQGRRLMEAVIDHARARGMHSIWACVSAENPAGATFHEAIGFEHVATLPEVGHKFGRWMDLILLRKLL